MTMNKRQAKKFKKKFEFKSYKMYKAYKFQHDLLFAIAESLDIPTAIAQMELNRLFR